MPLNPFPYTSRTFNTIYTDLKTLYPDQPDWFLVLIAGLFDTLHWYLDARAQNLLLSSAFTEESVLDLAHYLDYYPNKAAAATGQLIVHVSSVPHTILKADQIFRITTPQGQTVVFEGLTNVVLPGPGTTAVVNVIEGQTKSNVFIGTSDGSTGWQEMVLPDFNVLIDAANPITIVDSASNTWTQQPNLVNSNPTDRHFRILVKPNGVAAALFGNGTFGAIPIGGQMLATYRVGGGIAGNVPVNSTVSYIGADTVVTTVDDVSVAFSGGAASEDIETTRTLAPQMLKRNDRAVTQQDYELLSRRFSTGIIAAKCLPGLYGEGTVGVHIVPAGGGTPALALKANLQNYLIDRSPFGSVDVRVRDPLYVSQSISANVNMQPGFTYVAAYYTLALRLLVSETTTEIVNIYASSGIGAAVSYINNKWGYSFTQNDYTEISGMILRRIQLRVILWGHVLNPSDIITTLGTITGTNSVTLLSPTTQIILPFANLFTEGTMTVTQI